MTENIGKPTVEGLSEVAWARIERQVFTRLDSGDAVRAVTSLDERSARRAWRWIALPVGVAAAIALVLVATHRPEQIIAEGPSRVVSGDSPSTVSFADAHVSLDANSAVVLEHDAGSPTVLLERGAAWFSVAPRHERPAFVVLAGDATIRVIGTRFHVVRDVDRVGVSVDHGVVEVGFRGTITRVAAGATWTSDPMPELVQPTGPSVPMTLPGSSRPAMTPAQPSHHAAAQTKDPDQVKFEAIQAIEARQPARAIKGYLELSKGSGKWSQNALFAAARLAADPKNPSTHAKARTLAKIYLSRFPDGALARDAQRLLDQLEGETP